MRTDDLWRDFQRTLSVKLGLHRLISAVVQISIRVVGEIRGHPPPTINFVVASIGEFAWQRLTLKLKKGDWM